MSKAAELAALIGAQTAQGNKNFIINGAMEIFQRNSSVSSVSDNTYVVQDRMNFFSSNDGVITVTADSTHPTGAGFSKSLKVDVTTADSSIAAGQYLAINQRIEGLNHARLEYGTASAKSIVVSFYAKSNLTGPFCYSVKNSASDRSFPIEFSLSSADTWERISFTIPGDTSGTWLETNGLGAYHQISLAMGSTFQGTNNTWQAGNKVATSNQANLLSSTDNEFFLTGWQVEIGSGAPTAFEHEDISTTLAKCQRYFYSVAKGNNLTICNANSYSTTAVYGTLHFPVTMRSNPTSVGAATGTNYFRFYSAASATDFDSWSGLNDQTANGCTIYKASLSSLTAGRGGWFVTNNASASIYFSAEL